MKILAEHWCFPTLILLALDCITSFYIWSNGGYDLNPIYDWHTHFALSMMDALPFYVFIMVFTHIFIFYFTYLTSKNISVSYSGIPFLAVFLIYFYVVTNNFMVILWGVSLPWI